ncbi:uncharacterized protein LOC135831099 [Sycon ciliatum]|uniref:uncharacterized protein LOC135831099 n=1 Tax=Sycon ciliatum TaxID=27933 RepID=UPI0031F6A44D
MASSKRLAELFVLLSMLFIDGAHGSTGAMVQISLPDFLRIQPTPDPVGLHGQDSTLHFHDVVLSTKTSSSCRKLNVMLSDPESRGDSWTACWSSRGPFQLTTLNVTAPQLARGLRQSLDFALVKEHGSEVLVALVVDTKTPSATEINWSVQSTRGHSHHISGLEKYLKRNNWSVPEEAIQLSRSHAFASISGHFLSFRASTPDGTNPEFDDLPFQLMYSCTCNCTLDVSAKLNISLFLLEPTRNPDREYTHSENVIPKHVQLYLSNYTFDVNLVCKGQPLPIKSHTDSKVYNNSLAIGLPIISLVAAVILYKAGIVIFQRVRAKSTPAAPSEEDNTDNINNRLRQNTVESDTLTAEGADQQAVNDLLQHWIPLLKNVLLKSSEISIGNEIGVGAYGRVTAGSVMKGRQTMTVAVKTLKAVNSIEDVDNFLSEALIMQNFHHPNIVGLVGVCLRLSGPPLVCLEYMAEGDLRSYLQHLSKSISLEDIWSEWSFGVLMWEIFSLGRAPYRSILNENVRQYLELGERLTRPERCPEFVFQLMQQCWVVNADDRPTFQDARSYLLNHPNSCLQAHSIIQLSRQSTMHVPYRRTADLDVRCPSIEEELDCRADTGRLHVSYNSAASQMELADEHLPEMHERLPREPQRPRGPSSSSPESLSGSGSVSMSSSMRASLQPNCSALEPTREQLHASDAALLDTTELSGMAQSCSFTSNTISLPLSDLQEDNHIHV